LDSEARDGFVMPVTGLVGLPGSGKTLRAVQMALQAREAGRDVYANFRLGRREVGYLIPTCSWAKACVGYAHDFHKPTGYEFRTDPRALVIGERYGLRSGRGFVSDPGATLLTSWEQVLAIRVARDEFDIPHRLRLELVDDSGTDQEWKAVPTCNVWACNGCSNGITVVIDELNLWAPSRFWEKLGIGVLNRWAYVRKDGMHIVWTAQHEARIDKVAREVTDFIWSCRAFGGVFTFRKWSWHIQLFHRRKWIPALMTDKNRVSEGEGAKSNGLLGMDFEMSFWGGMKAASECYDTYEHVSESAHMSESGDARVARKPRLSAVK
jgi:zonular occludens toxin Zot